MTRHVLGADPGHVSGAASLLRGDTVVRWWTWQRLERKAGAVYRVTPSEGAQVEVPAMHEVGWTIAEGLPSEVALVVEGLFVARLRRMRRGESHGAYLEFLKRTLAQQQAAIPLAEAAGLLIGGIGLDPVARPPAAEWRSTELGMRSCTDAKAAGRYAMQMAPLRFRWPDGAGPGTQAEREALAESAFIGRSWRG